MPQLSSFAFVHDLPTDPALYVLYGGAGRSLHAAYVGITGSSFRSRMRQHFLHQDSSIVTGTSVASLNPRLVTQVEWWLDERFDDRAVLQAAEVIAFETFDPVLRSRGRTTNAARELLGQPQFQDEIREMMDTPSGRVEVQTLSDALAMIDDLTSQVQMLERRVAKLENNDGYRMK